ncbi:MAG: hypothetical protein SH808_06815 [Saprospiraceae bacterium]|nr:hypothetical protein [Saprospiraceae bacterium]
MKKINRNIWFLIALVSLVIGSCKEDDTEISTITSFEKFSTTVTPLVVAEADATHTITFNYDSKQIMDIHVEVEASAASTATEGVDYDLSAHEYSVSALGGSGSVDIAVYADFDPEGDETVVLHLTGTDVNGLPTPVESLVLTIRDSIYTVAVELNWDGSFVYDGDTYSICEEGVDIDLFLADGTGAFVGGFGGATGACPERMFSGTLADGTYSIVANLYGNALFGTPAIDTVPYPLSISLFKGGVLTPEATTIRYAAADFAQVPVWTTYTPSDPDGLANAILGQIRISGGTVTLVNPDGADVGSLNK